MKLIIYIPAFNEEENIRKVVENLPKKLDQIDTVQYLVIDDGSTDGTTTLAQSLGTQVVTHVRNRGVGAAFHTAVRYALENDADILVGIDADGQFDPAEIPFMIQPLLANQADMVIGNRFHHGKPINMPPVKYWGNRQIAGIVNFVSKQNFQDVSCGFRAYRRDALMRLNLFAEFTYTHETILSLVFQGASVVEYPIKVKYDPERKSRVAGSLIKYAAQTSKIILRVMLDYRPFYVFGSTGLSLVFIGILCVLFLLGHYAFTQSFTPYKSMGFIGLGFVIFGMLVLIIALVADMLNRLRMNQDKLLYEIKLVRYKK
jgi:glycosyltransferase involved in cell wall biosynthesis